MFFCHRSQMSNFRETNLTEPFIKKVKTILIENICNILLLKTIFFLNDLLYLSKTFIFKSFSYFFVLNFFDKFQLSTYFMKHSCCTKVKFYFYKFENIYLISNLLKIRFIWIWVNLNPVINSFKKRFNIFAQKHDCLVTHKNTKRICEWQLIHKNIFMEYESTLTQYLYRIVIYEWWVWTDKKCS
jgi:hypothetical protein